MSDTAFPVPSSESPALAVPPRRAAALRRLAWQLAPWALPALLFALWSVGSARGWIAPQILPPPERVVDTLADLASNGDLVHHTLIDRKSTRLNSSH